MKTIKEKTQEEIDKELKDLESKGKLKIYRPEKQGAIIGESRGSETTMWHCQCGTEIDNIHELWVHEDQGHAIREEK